MPDFLSLWGYQSLMHNVSSLRVAKWWYSNSTIPFSFNNRDIFTACPHLLLGLPVVKIIQFACPFW